MYAPPACSRAPVAWQAFRLEWVAPSPTNVGRLWPPDDRRSILGCCICNVCRCCRAAECVLHAPMVDGSRSCWHCVVRTQLFAAGAGTTSKPRQIRPAGSSQSSTKSQVNNHNNYNNHDSHKKYNIIIVIIIIIIVIAIAIMIPTRHEESGSFRHRNHRSL